MNRKLLTLLAAMAIVSVSAVEFKAGYAQTDITPPLGV